MGCNSQLSWLGKLYALNQQIFERKKDHFRAGIEIATPPCFPRASTGRENVIAPNSLWARLASLPRRREWRGGCMALCDIHPSCKSIILMLMMATMVEMMVNNFGAGNLSWLPGAFFKHLLQLSSSHSFLSVSCKSILVLCWWVASIDCITEQLTYQYKSLGPKIKTEGSQSEKSPITVQWFSPAVPSWFLWPLWLWQSQLIAAYT